VNRAYFVYPIRPGLVQATAQFAQSAKEAGVEAIVNMPQVSARADATSHCARDHWLGERIFDWSGNRGPPAADGRGIRRQASRRVRLTGVRQVNHVAL
jgi:hypothetical protein